MTPRRIRALMCALHRWGSVRLHVNEHLVAQACHARTSRVYKR